MANRIAYWWKEVQDWKKQFDKFLRTNGISSGKEILKEELKKYNGILQRKLGNMTSEERITRKHLIAERNKLYRQIYPNVAVRLFRSAGNLFTSFIKMTISRGLNIKTSPQSRRILERFELSEMIKGTETNTFKPSYSESLNSEEILDYKLKFKEMDNGKPVVYGFELSMEDLNGDNKKILITDEMNLNKYHARELLYGRSINNERNNWIVPDLTDRDSKGYIKVKEITIPNFCIKEKLLTIPGTKFSKKDLDRIYDELKNGKQSEIMINNGKSDFLIQIEVNPLKREFHYYQNGKKVKFEEINGKNTIRNPKVIAININENKKVKI